MVDIFVSYNREDRARVTPLVEALERAGLSVWWDRDIPGGANWRRTIMAHLESARCVIVVWSEASVGPIGEFVQEEAHRARSRHILLPIRIDDVTEPLGFGHLQSLDLVNWAGRPDDSRLDHVVAAAKAIIDGRPYVPPEPGPSRSPITLLALAIIALVSKYLNDLIRFTWGPKQFLSARGAADSRG
jgi:TIR domain